MVGRVAQTLFLVLRSLLNLVPIKPVSSSDCAAFQLQEAFADCAADIKSTFESQDARQMAPHWPASALNCTAVLFLRAGRTQDAW